MASFFGGKQKAYFQGLFLFVLGGGVCFSKLDLSQDMIEWVKKSRFSVHVALFVERCLFFTKPVAKLTVSRAKPRRFHLSHFTYYWLDFFWINSILLMVESFSVFFWITPPKKSRTWFLKKRPSVKKTFFIYIDFEGKFRGTSFSPAGSVPWCTFKAPIILTHWF